MTSHSNNSLIEIKSFIKSHFKNVTEIEMICFFRQEPSGSFSPRDICSRLFLSELMTKQTLDHLLLKGLIIEINDSNFQFNKNSPFEMNGSLTILQELFTNRKAAIIETLFNSHS